MTEPAVTPQPWNRDSEHLLRDLAPQVLGVVVRRFRDFASAEDAVQEALVAAALQWPNDGLPDNPRAWLTQVALRRMTDQVRSEAARRRRETEATPVDWVAPSVDLESDPEQDDTLILLFMCCHPALTQSSAIALTLRAVGGLTTAEIASAFLVPEPTMAQRISRAKQSIKASGVPFRMPTAADREQRLRSVLHVLYLIFNEGYASSAGATLQRLELAQRRHSPGASAPPPAARGCRSRRPAGAHAVNRRAARRPRRAGRRTDPADATGSHLWDRHEIAEGTALLTAALAKGAVGAYQLQAAIAALHDEAPRVEDTDWPQILALYDLLQRMSDNPVVMLNHAIAVAMVQGPRAGLQLVEELDAGGRLAGNHRPDAVRAHLLEMAGDYEAAVAHFRKAASLATNLPERNYLTARAAQLAAR